MSCQSNPSPSFLSFFDEREREIHTLDSALIEELSSAGKSCENMKSSGVRINEDHMPHLLAPKREEGSSSLWKKRKIFFIFFCMRRHVAKKAQACHLYTENGVDGSPESGTHCKGQAGML